MRCIECFTTTTEKPDWKVTGRFCAFLVSYWWSLCSCDVQLGSTNCKKSRWVQLGLYTPKIETGALRDPGRQSWFREALPPPAFRFYLQSSSKENRKNFLSICTPKQASFSFSEGKYISAPVSHPVLWLVSV